jgi:hypothetical protein
MMGWLIAVAAYLLLVLLVCLFLKGGSLREESQPQRVVIDFLLLEQMRSDSAATLDWEWRDDWAGETHLSAVRSAQSNP